MDNQDAFENIEGIDFINNNKLLLKICTQTATTKDIEEWSRKNNIQADDLNTTIEKLIAAFKKGSNEMIIIKLRYILDSLNTLTNEVITLISEIGKN